MLRDLGGTWRDPREIEWDTMTPERFHYDVVQRPGPRNPLGRAKFMFPNRYAVYLHDTPNQALFEEDRRAFSRGCVRVEDADTLAALLLEHRNGVRRPDIVTLRAAGDEVKIELERAADGGAAVLDGRGRRRGPPEDDRRPVRARRGGGAGAGRGGGVLRRGRRAQPFADPAPTQPSGSSGSTPSMNGTPRRASVS